MAEDEFLCSSIKDCPFRFRCYPSSPDSPDGGKQCSCARSMLFSGPDCMAVDGFAVFTFCFTFYLMLRCANHSHQVFKIHLKKWKMERQVDRSTSLSLPLIAGLWILSASLFFTICCGLNAGRMFTAGFEDKIFVRSTEFCFAMGGLFMVLASNVMGLFWGQTALWHEAGTTGRAPSFIRTYRRYSFILLLVFLTILALVGTRFYGKKNWHYISYLLLFWAPLISTVSIVCGGTCLIQRKLNKLSESSSQAMERVLSNIRRSAFKILSHTILTIFISTAFFIFENLPEGVAPRIINHLLLVSLYVNINMTLIAMGEYLVCTDVKCECACAPRRLFLVMQSIGRVHQGHTRRRRVSPEEEQETHHHRGMSVPVNTDTQRSSTMRSILGIPPPADYLFSAQGDKLASIAEQHELSDVGVGEEKVDH